MNRQTIIETLADPSTLPWETISFCLKHPDETEQVFIMLLERATRKPDTLDPQEERALFYGIHLLGALGSAAATERLMALLTGDVETAAHIVGDAIGSTIPRVLMALGQGNEAEFWEVVSNPALDWLVRDAFLKAWTFQVLEGRINRKEAENALRSLPDILKLHPDDMFWLSWMTAIAHLGFQDLAEDVPERIAGGRIDGSLQTVSAEDLADFEALLQDALQQNQTADWRAQNSYIPFSPTFADFELASRSLIGRTDIAETPRLMAADKETPFDDHTD